ncbi:MAG: site-specific integrase [Deltaproteobacteria bacterium]|nr:site-specific integrase [Deltaproteobacteria bacterium]
MTQGILTKTDTVSLIDWANQYLDYSKMRVSAKTYKEKVVVFKALFSLIDKDTPADTLTPTQCLKFLSKIAKDKTGHRANRYRKNLTAGWELGKKYFGLPLINPWTYVDKFPEVRHDRQVPTEDDFWRIYELAETEQDRIMLLTYLHTAARRSELFNLKWDDVDFSEQRIRLWTRKRKNSSLEFNWLPMSDELFDELLRHKQQATNEWVFPNPDTGTKYLERKRWMNGLCKRAGVKPFGLHGIRHLSGSILAGKNISAIDIQSVLRHKNLSTTERYLHQLSDLRLVVNNLSSKKKPSAEPSPSTAASLRIVK